MVYSRIKGYLTGWSSGDTAQRIYDDLDPYYGEGGLLEPVTVLVDPDRTVKEEYIEPAIDYGLDYSQDALDTFRQASQDSYDEFKAGLDAGADKLIGMVLILGLAYVASR